MPLVSRNEIIKEIRNAVEPLAEVQAMWLGGSDAFQRSDELSDIDVQLLIEPGTQAVVFAVVEDALEQLAGIAVRQNVPEPAWHGHSQRFYQLRQASDFHVVDLFILEAGKPPFWNEVEHHGEPVVVFDKAGKVCTTHIDKRELLGKIRQRISQLDEHLAIHAIMVDKEIRRGNELAAFHFYLGLVLLPLVEVLRMRFSPFRYNWGLRYAYYDLPPDVYEKLVDLAYLGSMPGLQHKLETAHNWLLTELRTAAGECGVSLKYCG